MKTIQKLALTGLMVHLLTWNIALVAQEELLSDSMASRSNQEECTQAMHGEESTPIATPSIQREEPVVIVEQNLEEQVSRAHLPISDQDTNSSMTMEESVDTAILKTAISLPTKEEVVMPVDLLFSQDRFDEDPEEIFDDFLQEVNLAEQTHAEGAQIVIHAEHPLNVSIPDGAPRAVSVDPPTPLLEEKGIVVDLKQAFAGSPIIYTLLLSMSVLAVCLWLYSILSIRSWTRVSPLLLQHMQNRLHSNQFEETLLLCEEHNNIFCKMISSGIHARRHGLPMMVDAMKAEGKRVSIFFWQKIGLINDIAILAPMIGLLGTVLGMFYAFYDVNRSLESISTLFDGLGISVGTTVAGLMVAILALILHSTAKYRLVRALVIMENKAQHIAHQIDDRTSVYKG